MLRLMDFGLRGGLIKGKRVREVFREQFVEREFSELEVPFAAVATDLHSGQEVWLREGKVSAAIGASIAVPGLFQPVAARGSLSRRRKRRQSDSGLVVPRDGRGHRAGGRSRSDLVGRYAREDDRPPRRPPRADSSAGFCRGTTG